LTKASGSARAFVAAHLALAVVLSALVQPRLTLDSAGYLNHAPYRPPLVPVVYALLGAFGGAQLRAIVLVQLVVAVLAAWALARALVAFVDEPPRLAYLVFYALFVPQLNHALCIMSDALSFSLFSLTVAAALAALRAPGPRTIARVAAWSTAAWLARAQFLFLAPLVVVGAAAFVAAAPRARWRSAAVCAAIVGAGALGSPLYNRAFNGAFLSLGAKGMHLLAVVTYVAQPDDLSALHDPVERRFESEVLAQAKEKRLLRSDVGKYQPEAHHFYGVFDPIALDTIEHHYAASVLGRPVPHGLVGDGFSPREWGEFDRFATHVALQLLTRNAGRYLVHIFTCAYQLYRVFGFLVLVLLAIGLLAWRRPTGQLLLLVSILWIANLALVSLVQVPYMRYTFPTDAVVLAALIPVVVRATR
jgi:hypothetical protein